MQQTNMSISSLVDMYERGELRLPEIQRHYVWRSTRVRDLLDSLYRGYPSGSILLWETDEPIPTRDSAIKLDGGGFAGCKLLLDGQQRLTSLTSVIKGKPVQVRGRKKPIDILFNLEHPDGPPLEVTEVEEDVDSPTMSDDEFSDEGEEENGNGESGISIAERFTNKTFIVSSKGLAAQPTWLPVTQIFKSSGDAELLKKAGVASFDDPRYQKYSDRIARVRRIKDYNYVVHILERAMDYEEVTEIFVRVNSLGAKLRSSDLALAQISSRWPHLLKELEEFQDECEQSWFTLDFGLLIRAMVVLATKQCLFKPVSLTPIEQIKKGWSAAKDGLRFAINFLRTNAGIEDESLLSSPFFIVTLAAISRAKDDRLSSQEQHALLHWLLVANARGRYSRGSSESILNEDLAIIFRTGNIGALMEPLKRQFGRLTIEAGDLASRGVGSPLFSLAYLTLKDAGARDWFNGLGLSLTHQGRLHFIQWHHIFPKSLLKEQGYETGEINEIANMAFITGQTNRRISNKEPKAYLAAIQADQGKQALERQLVPADPAMWELKRYRDFLAQRRQDLSALMNAFIAKQANLQEEIP